MVGEWADASDDLDVTAVCHWTANQHFLIRSHTVTVNGEIDLQGTEIIAYDAAAKQYPLVDVRFRRHFHRKHLEAKR